MQLCYISASFLKEEEIFQLNKLPLASGNLNAVFSPEAAEITQLCAHGQEGDGNLQNFSIESSSTAERNSEFPTFPGK